MHRLDVDESRHALRVLRLTAGAPVELFDGAGWTARGTLEAGAGKAARVRVVQAWREAPLRPALTLAAAVPKGPHAEAMVEAMSQLGATMWLPLICDRSVVRPRPAKLDRWRRGAIESAKQCGRAHVMQIDDPTSFEEALARPASVKLLLTPGAEGEAGLMERVRDVAEVLALVGPEGGWSEGELAAAAANGVARWEIAPHVLRIETAAAAACTLVRYLTGG